MARFGDSVRSKTDTVMRNEVYCKIIAHNLCCLIMSQFELGIEPEFWKDKKVGRNEEAESILSFEQQSMPPSELAANHPNSGQAVP